MANHTLVGTGGCWALVCQEGRLAATGNTHHSLMHRRLLREALLLRGALPTHAGKDRHVHAAEDVGLCVQAEREREREERVRRRVGEELRALEVKSQGKL